MITRKNFLKLISFTGIMLLTGCNKQNTWEATGNTKNFEKGMHFIYIKAPSNDTHGQIAIPEGYEYVSSENLFFITKYNYVNKVEVNALQYENTKTKKKIIPFPWYSHNFSKNKIILFFLSASFII